MIEPEVIYEDKNFIAVNKPTGMLVHSTQTYADKTRTYADKTRIHADETQTHADKTRTYVERGPRGFVSLVDWLVKNYPEVQEVGDDPKTRPGIVHRLDQDTSGVMLVARNQKYFEYLKSLFKEHKIKKTYLALVWGKLASKVGVIDKPIGIKSGTIRRTTFSDKMIKSAITEYRVLKCFSRSGSARILDNRGLTRKDFFSLVQVVPRTGRTHQIRVHLASIGHPVVGDKIYGHKKQLKGFSQEPQARRGLLARLMLHALSLEFAVAPGKRIKIDAEPPEEFERVIAESNRESFDKLRII